MIKEFREFITKGNVLDLAIAVVMGAAFGKIVSSLVDNIITPLIGILLGGVNFSSFYLSQLEKQMFNTVNLSKL